MQTPPVKDGPRINEDIRVPRVLLIDQNGEKQGEMPTSAALEAAEEAGLDLVEIVPNIRSLYERVLPSRAAIRSQSQSGWSRKQVVATEAIASLSTHAPAESIRQSWRRNKWP